ncbi:MAG: hypothetical protein ABJA98_17020 [Acidobacteriota bacterium]
MKMREEAMRASGRPLTRTLLSACILHAAACLSMATARAEIIDRALVVVAGVVITQSDATAASELGVVTSGGTGDPLAGVLAQLVERQLMLTEVDRSAAPEPSTDAVDRRLQAIRARFASTPVYEAVLRRSGIDEMRLRQTLRDQLRIDAYLDQRFSAPPLTAERRAELIKEWVAGLKRRADISYLDVPRS